VLPGLPGHGMVRARDGRPFRTVDGALVAEEHGTAADCRPCDGSGLPTWPASFTLGEGL
jgi:hypothetical protein